MAVTVPEILVDADACPVKDEVYRVAGRYELNVRIVANSFMMVPQSPLIEGVIVGSGFDAADDWIAEHASPSAIVVTRSEEHTSELQSLMRNSYAVFCLKKKT